MKTSDFTIKNKNLHSETLLSDLDLDFETLVQLAAVSCQCSAAFLSLKVFDTFKIKSTFQLENVIEKEKTSSKTTPKDGSKKLKIGKIQDTFISENNILKRLSEHSLFHELIINAEGKVIGKLYVVDKPSKNLTKLQSELLSKLAHEVQEKLENHVEKKGLEKLNTSVTLAKDYYSNIINNIGNAVLILDVNLNLIEFYGEEEGLVSEKELFLGKNIAKIHVISKLYNQIKLAIKACKLYHSSIPIEYELIKGGIRHYYVMYVNLIHNNDNPQVVCVIREINRKDRKKERLKIFNNLFSEAEKLAKVGGWRFDLKEREMYWTPILKNIAEIDPDVQPNLEETISFFKEGKNRDTFTEKVIESIEQQTSFKGEYKMISAKNNEVWALVNVKPDLVNGECIGLYGSFQDITEIKKTKENLKLERERLNNIINAANLGTWEWNIQTGETIFNKRFVNILGYSTEELPLNNSFKLWNSFTHPKDLKQSKVTLKEHFDGKTEFYQKELRLKHKNGTWVWVLDKGKVISWTEDGEPEWMFGTQQDISTKKALEKELHQNVQQFKNIFELSPVGIVITDLVSGKFLDVNKAMQAMIGYTKEEFLNMSIWKITPEKQITDEDSKGIQNLKDLNKAGPIEKSIKTKSGDLLTVLINGLIHFDENGKRIVISTLQDITEQKRIEKKLENSRSEAINASRAKSEFVANMSHEIRTPLNGVIGFSDLLMKTPLDEVQYQYMKTVFQSANILLDLINDVLDFSKIESGKLQLNTEKTNLLNIVEEVIDLTKYEAHKKGLELILIVEDKVPDYVWVDEIRIKQILMNLLNNSIKFTNKGFVKLRISLKNESNNLSNLVFSVEDTGIGIAKENQKKIFKAFIQEDTSVTKKYGGTGLGLAISDKILNSMDSKLKLKSKIGQGSRFYFSVSLKSENPIHKTYNSIEDIQRVLVLTSVKDYYETIENHLGRFQIETKQAQDFEIASKKIKEFSPQIIFINQDTSIEEAFSLAHELKTQCKFKNVRFILLKKANSKDNNQNDGFEKMFDHVIVKPIKLNNLIKVLSSHEQEEGLIQKKEQKEKIIKVLKSLKVLVVEDNLINMELIKSYLNNIYPGVKIFEAEVGNKAIMLFKTHKPDIVFSDIQMPNMNGYELTGEIRKDRFGKKVPIIAITAGTVVGTKEKCLEAGMNDYVSKPILQESIKQIILKYIPVNNLDSEEKPQVENSGKSSTNDKSERFEKEPLMEMIGHNEKFFNELIKLADETLNEALKELEEFKNREELSLLAHKLKGTALNLGATSLTECAVEIEKSQKTRPKELELEQKKLIEKVSKLKESLPVI